MKRKTTRRGARAQFVRYVAKQTSRQTFNITRHLPLPTPPCPNPPFHTLFGCLLGTPPPGLVRRHRRCNLLCFARLSAQPDSGVELFAPFPPARAHVQAARRGLLSKLKSASIVYIANIYLCKPFFYFVTDLLLTLLKVHICNLLYT